MADYTRQVKTLLYCVTKTITRHCGLDPQSHEILNQVQNDGGKSFRYGVYLITDVILSDAVKETIAYGTALFQIKILQLTEKLKSEAAQMKL